ncbi:PepSY domain-containing protein [Fontibacillus sp. BL9]|uniref:PepSY domain-containing protein n=1 Tax=Fontibacillus sp. BL9 TaxID=3389971 RepID=UPI00397A371E
MKKVNMWVGAASIMLLIGATTVAASGNVTGESTGVTQNGTGSAATSKTAIQQAGKSYITIEQAKAAALKAEAGRVSDVELERKSGKVYYEVEIDQTNGEVDVLVDAVTGKILGVKDKEKDDDDHDFFTESNGTVPAKVKITSDQASAIAVKQVTGGTVVKVELDYDDGRYVYEAELKTAQGEADVEIDATTGKVYSVDQDFDDRD